MKVTYSHNNSGGSWWLTKKDWETLEKGGWAVEWDEFLGSPARRATKNFPSVEEAKNDWSDLLRMNPDDEGCECCGPPHEFYSEYYS